MSFKDEDIPTAVLVPRKLSTVSTALAVTYLGELKVKIAGRQTDDEGVTRYTIQLTGPDGWTILQRRYSEFEKLHRELFGDNSQAIPMPPKSYLKSRFSSKFQDERERRLGEIATACLESVAHLELDDCPPVLRRFLGLMDVSSSFVCHTEFDAQSTLSFGAMPTDFPMQDLTSSGKLRLGYDAGRLSLSYARVQDFLSSEQFFKQSLSSEPATPASEKSPLRSEPATPASKKFFSPEDMGEICFPIAQPAEQDSASSPNKGFIEDLRELKSKAMAVFTSGQPTQEVDKNASDHKEVETEKCGNKETDTFYSIQEADQHASDRKEEEAEKCSSFETEAGQAIQDATQIESSYKDVAVEEVSSKDLTSSGKLRLGYDAGRLSLSYARVQAAQQHEEQAAREAQEIALRRERAAKRAAERRKKDVPAVCIGSAEGAEATVPSTEGADAAAANVCAEAAAPSTHCAGTEVPEAAAADTDHAEVALPRQEDTRAGAPSKELAETAALSEQRADVAPSNEHAETVCTSTGHTDQEHVLPKELHHYTGKSVLDKTEHEIIDSGGKYAMYLPKTQEMLETKAQGVLTELKDDALKAPLREMLSKSAEDGSLQAAIASEGVFCEAEEKPTALCRAAPALCVGVAVVVLAASAASFRRRSSL